MGFFRKDRKEEEWKDTRTDVVVGRLESVADRMEKLARILEEQLAAEKEAALNPPVPTPDSRPSS